MPPRRRIATPPPIDVPSVRRKLDEGKIVRVGISRSAQFPDGATGRVRRVGDPAVDGEEYVQVELSLNGTKDVLPFTPADLTPATRGRPPGSGSAVGTEASGVGPRRSAPVARPGKATAASGPRIHSGASPLDADLAGPDSRGPSTAAPQQPSLAIPSRSIPSPSIPPAPIPPAPMHPAPNPPAPDPLAPDPLASAPSGSIRSASAHSERPPVAMNGAAPTAEQQATKVRTPTKAARAGRKPATVAITIATTDNDPNHWRIEARVGARVVLRAGAIPPARVWELVRVLDDQTLIAAVGAILDEQRKDAQARVDALAAELARVRAELDALPGGTM